MKITIAGGAGNIGSAAAFSIVLRNLADEIVLIDPREKMLTSHWIDLATAVTGKNIIVTRGAYEKMAGSDIVLVAASIPSDCVQSRRDYLPRNLPIIKEIGRAIDRLCPEAIVFMVTNPVDSLNYAMYLMATQKDRRRFIGYSLNDTMRFLMASAKILGVESSRIDGMTMGEHGESLVQLFSTLTVDGKVARVDADIMRQIREEAPKSLRTLATATPNRTASWTSAIGMMRVLSALVNNTGETMPASAVLDGEYGCRGLSMAVPARIDGRGIRGIEELELSAGELEAVRHTVDVLTTDMRYVEDHL